MLCPTAACSRLPKYTVMGQEWISSCLPCQSSEANFIRCDIQKLEGKQARFVNVQPSLVCGLKQPSQTPGYFEVSSPPAHASQILTGK